MVHSRAVQLVVCGPQEAPKTLAYSPWSLYWLPLFLLLPPVGPAPGARNGLEHLSCTCGKGSMAIHTKWLLRMQQGRVRLLVP